MGADSPVIMAASGSAAWRPAVLQGWSATAPVSLQPGRSAACWALLLLSAALPSRMHSWHGFALWRQHRGISS